MNKKYAFFNSACHWMFQQQTQTPPEERTCFIRGKESFTFYILCRCVYSPAGVSGCPAAATCDWLRDSKAALSSLPCCSSTQNSKYWPLTEGRRRWLHGPLIIHLIVNVMFYFILTLLRCPHLVLLISESNLRQWWSRLSVLKCRPMRQDRS